MFVGRVLGRSEVFPIVHPLVFAGKDLRTGTGWCSYSYGRVSRVPLRLPYPTCRRSRFPVPHPPGVDGSHWTTGVEESPPCFGRVPRESPVGPTFVPITSPGRTGEDACLSPVSSLECRWFWVCFLSGFLWEFPSVWDLDGARVATLVFST